MSANTKTDEERAAELREVLRRFPPLTEEERAAMTPEQLRRRRVDLMNAVEGKFNIELIDIDKRGTRS